MGTPCTVGFAIHNSYTKSIRDIIKENIQKQVEKQLAVNVIFVRTLFSEGRNLFNIKKRRHGKHVV